MYVIMIAGTLALAGRDGWKRYLWLIPALLGGLIWNLVMLQHTAIHKFAAMFGYFAWMLVVASFFLEVYRAFQRAFSPARAKVAFAALFAPLCAVALQPYYATYLVRYLHNIAAGQVVDQEKSTGHGGKKKRKHGRPNKHARPTNPAPAKSDDDSEE
jgi:hypothetical protein